MIVGIGTDIAGMDRMARLLDGSRGEAFLRRVLTEAERRIAVGRSANRRRYVEFIAGRWAAKEAVVKALGCGIGALVGLRDIEILPGESGKPVCVLSDSAWNRLGYDGTVRSRPAIHISITHSDGLAAAFAVAERLGE
ncbi:holo-ACP synthase [Paenibacillus alkalitolerans]|uniref:holo-ACP synthase n=1 Tax=Paenibacillus alkalitolerans TaxID=2799335 RepID=UPI0018F59805|nr:holo-ACP synthase [Paenibacillus alkalitolerans]